MPRTALFRSLALLPLAIVLAGCGGGSETTTSAATATAPSTTATTAASQVPDSIRSKGTLAVAADATYAPNEFVGSDGKTVQGMDADLAEALATELGLKAKMVNASFDSIIPGLAADKYDLGMSSFTDTKAREKVVDFVTYFSAGTSFYVQPSGPAITGLSDLCGHKVAVERGTVQATDATTQSAKCKADGKSPVNVLVYPDQNAANLAISSGRAEIGMADSPVAAYIVKQSNGKFKLVGTPYGTAPYGIAIPKGNGMAAPVLAALKALMANGTYDTILQKWGVQAGAITNPQINGATS